VTIENLVRVAPPPAAPSEAFVGDWGPIERAVGTALPADLKEFARLYGSGEFMEFMWIAVPWASDHGAEYARWVGQACGIFHEVPMPCPLWPDAGGLFPAGVTSNGDQIFWLPRGDPESWRIAVWDRGRLEGEELEIFDCDLTDFLAGLVTGAITPKAFPDDFLPCDHLFQPSEAGA
jgi:hypothetical protein